MKLFLFSSIFYQTFYHVPIHERLTAEEIYFQIYPVSGIGDKKIQSLFSHLIGHQSSSAVVLSLLCKAVPAGKITVMGNVKTQCFYYCLSFFKMVDCL